MLKTTKFETFNDKMIISTSKDDKKILLWDENTMSVIYTYEDNNMKSFISKEKLFTIGKDLYSEYILALQENKSLMTIWKTNSSECLLKCNPIDERITSIDISQNDKLILISTETGNLFIYELFSGNLLNSIQIVNSTIHSVKSLTRDGGLILILSEDYIKLVSLENLLKNNSSDQSILEIPNYEQFNKFFHIFELNLIIFYSLNNSKNKITICEFPNLKIVKSLYIQNNYLITNIVNDYNNLFVAFESGNIFVFDIREIINTNQDGETVLNFIANENIFPIIQTESKINSICISEKNILTGLEDGKIILWNKFNFKKENILSLHKGGITNVMQINRPISQYGLNFNQNIEEVMVKSLKKPSAIYAHNLAVKNSIKNENFVDNFLEEYLEDEDRENKGNFTKNLSSNPNSLNENINSSLKVKKNNLNLDDNNFLRSKLKEALNILNK